MRHCLVSLIAALLTAGCKPTSDDIYAALPAEGATVPAFRYTALDGAVLDPASLRGRPAVVALWSSTCSASRRALEAIGAAHTAYAARGATVLILADDSDRTRVEPLLAQAAVRAPVAMTNETLMDTFTHDQSVLPWRKAFALPTFLVLDAQGRVVYRQIGIEADPNQQLGRVRALLDSLLRAPSAVASEPPAD
jgi:hypothetical protein